MKIKMKVFLQYLEFRLCNIGNFISNYFLAYILKGMGLAIGVLIVINIWYLILNW